MLVHVRACVCVCVCVHTCVHVCVFGGGGGGGKSFCDFLSLNIFWHFSPVLRHFNEKSLYQ